MADNGVLLKAFEKVCRCQHEWKFRIEKEGYKKYWCPKCNGIKREIVDNAIDDWNYDMDSCPLDTKVCLLSGDGDLLLPQQEFVGTIIHNGRYKTRGECYSGDPEYFYRSAIVAWKEFLN